MSAVRSPYDIIAVTDSAFNHTSLNCNLPDIFNVYRAEHDCLKSAKKYGDVSVLSVRSSIASFKRPDLETLDQYVWIEIRLRCGSQSSA